MKRYKVVKRRIPVRMIIIVAVLLFIAIPLGVYFRDMQIAKQLINSGSKTMNTPIGTIEYYTYGTGKPLLISHGAGGGFDQGILISKIIGQGYRFILPSRFGYLQSKTNLMVTPRLQAEAYTYILEDLGIPKVSVAAFSAGGLSALSFASYYPGHCEKLMMISAISVPIPNSKNDPTIETAFKLLLQSDFLYWSATKVFRSKLLSLFGLAKADQQKLTGRDKKWIDDFFYTTMPATLRAQGNMNDMHMGKPYVREMRKIKAPALIIHVRQDPFISFRNAEYSHQYIPGSTLIAFENGGHFSMGHHGEIAAEIRAFLNQ